MSNDFSYPTIQWNTIRKRSLQSGGLGSERIDIWPQLLGICSREKNQSLSQSVHSDTESVHSDERQIRLDTDRSFVLYPVDDTRDRDQLQNELNELIVALFRKRPRLNYFQGYHDIISVLLLTLPPELQLLCAEKLSLHRVRDSMGPTLEPVIGLLRILSNLLSLADPEYSALLNRSSNLPYFALSNLLTLFSHDVPTLPLIQHIFDYLLCRPPISAVYLAAAVVLSRKDEALRLEEEGEEGMLHSLLSSLPDLYEEDETIHETDSSNILAGLDRSEELETAAQATTAAHPNEDEIAPELLAQPSNTDTQPSPLSSPPINDTPQTSADLLDGVQPDETVDKADKLISENSDELLDDQAAIQVDEDAKNHTPDQEDIIPRSDSPESVHRTSRRPRVSMTALLHHADTLYQLFPPSHPTLALSSIMGPRSVIFTWTEDFSKLPSDDEAEAIVTQPQLVVYPPPEPPESKEEVEADEENEKRKRRKLRKRRPFKPLVRRRTIVASAVLAVGIAMAVYGAGGFRGGHHEVHRGNRGLAKFIGALLLGAGEKFLDKVFGPF